MAVITLAVCKRMLRHEVADEADEKLGQDIVA